MAGVPFVSGTFIQHPRSFWSTPQAYYLGQIQATEFDIGMQAEKQRRLATLRFMAREGSFKEGELNKLLSGEVGAVGLVDTSHPLSDILKEVPTGTQLDYVLQSAANKRKAQEAVGFSNMDMGELSEPQKRVTSAEAKFVQSGSQRRAGRRTGVVTSLYTDAIEKLNKVVFSFWKTPRYAMVGTNWVPFTGEQLMGNYIYDTSLSTKRNLSRAERKVEALMIFSQFAQAGMASPDLFQYIIDAAGDPAFERILAPAVGKTNQTPPNTGSVTRTGS